MPLLPTPPRVTLALPLPRVGRSADVFPRCMVLAVLVHVWLALSLTARPDPATPGPGGWGRLEVTLTGPGGTALRGDASAPAPDANWRDDGPLGEAPTPRFGGVLRREAPAPDAGPGAQTLGRWKAVAQNSEADPDPSLPDDDTPPAPARPVPAAPTPPAVAQEAAPAAPATEAPPQPPAAPPPPEPAAATAPTLRALPDEAAPPQPALQTQRVASTEIATVAAPLATAPALPEVPPAPTLRTLDAPARPAALVTRAPVLAPPLTPATAAPLARAPDLPEVPPAPTLRTLDVPTRAPTVAARTLPSAPLAAPRTAQAAAPLARAPELPEVPPAPTLRALDAPTPRTARAADLASGPTLTQPLRQPLNAAAYAQPLGAAPTLPDVPPAPTLRTLDAPARAPAAVARDAVPALDAPRVAERLSPLPTDALGRDLPAPRGVAPDATAPGPSNTTTTAGAPDAGSQVGHDVATAPSASASAPPRPLNLALPRSAGPTARRSPGLLELLPALPDTKSKLEKAVEEAGREDCRKAHADKGVLGVLPLALDSARGKGCKW